MQIINIDADPCLRDYDPSIEGHIFAGHAREIVGVNYCGTMQQARVCGINPAFYRSSSEMNSALKEKLLQTIWINHGANTEFSIILNSKEVILKFLSQYGEIINYKNFFIVCDDFVLRSNNSETNKLFFPINSVPQFESDFKIWPL